MGGKGNGGFFRRVAYFLMKNLGFHNQRHGITLKSKPSVRDDTAFNGLMERDARSFRDEQGDVILVPPLRTIQVEESSAYKKSRDYKELKKEVSLDHPGSAVNPVKPEVGRVKSHIDEKSDLFIEERKKSFASSNAAS